jgi:hypothetical protein
LPIELNLQKMKLLCRLFGIPEKIRASRDCAGIDVWRQEHSEHLDLDVFNQLVSSLAID